jgi:hypothetical protein
MRRYNKFWRSLSKPRQFQQRSDFIAVGVRKQQIDDIRREMAQGRRGRAARTRDRREEQARSPVIELPMADSRLALDCPLDWSWPDWDIFRAPIFSVIPDDDWYRCEAARGLFPVRHLGIVPLTWHRAPSGDPYARDPPPWRLIHATVNLNGPVVHVDWVRNIWGGPGRVINEFRVSVDRQLAGRGGSFGCSIGAAGNDLPLVARIDADRAITLDWAFRGLPIVELWEVKRKGPITW